MTGRVVVITSVVLTAIVYAAVGVVVRTSCVVTVVDGGDWDGHRERRRRCGRQCWWGLHDERCLPVMAVIIDAAIHVRSRD